MFYSCALSNTQGGGESQTASKTAMTVAGNPVPANIIDETVRAQLSSQMSRGADTPQGEAMIYAEVINRLVDTAGTAALAQKSGVKLDDETLLKAAEYGVTQELDAMREQASMFGMLKPGATDKDWEEALQKQTGQSSAEYRKTRVDQISAMLKNASQRQNVVINLARTALEQHLTPKFKLTDDELRKSFENVTYKRIVFKNAVPGKPAAERAAEALKAIKGGLKFEAAIDKYTNELPTSTQKLSEVTQTEKADLLTSNPELASLANLKAGSVSDVVDVAEGKAIYKVVSRTPNIPKDFDTKREEYRRKAILVRVRLDIDKQLKELKAAGNLVSFAAPGYKAMYDFTQAAATSDPEKMKGIYEEAKAAVAKNEGYDARAAVLARYMALDSLWNAPNADKAKLRQDRIDSINGLLENSENFNLRLDLVQLYADEKKAEEASEQLLIAAQNNATPDVAGLGRYQQIAQKVVELKARKVLTPEAEKGILAEQDRWMKEKAEADKVAEEQKKQEEEEKRKAEAEQKRLDAEAKKDAENAKKNPPATTAGTTGTTGVGTTGLMPPTTTGGTTATTGTPR
ncbi:MAG: hypothetical protein ACO1SV_19945 [Fimbriimonas sp.]